MMQKKLFLFVVASALNYGSGMSIPPTSQQFNYENSTDPFMEWFLSKFFGFKLGEKISSTGIVVVKISKMSTFSSFCLT